MIIFQKQILDQMKMLRQQAKEIEQLKKILAEMQEKESKVDEDMITKDTLPGQFFHTEKTL